MKKIKYLIIIMAFIVLSIIYNIFSKIYIVFTGGTISLIKTYKIECGYPSEVIDNTFLENISRNLSMMSDLCINLARLRIFNILVLSLLLSFLLFYTLISYKNLKPFRSIDDLLSILIKRNKG